MAISRQISVKVNKNSAKINGAIALYENDRGIDLYFDILELPYKFDGIVSPTFSSFRIKKPSGFILKTGKMAVYEGKAILTITHDMTDEFEEIGVYQFQIHLYDNFDNRITMPIIEFEVFELLKGQEATVDGVGYAVVGRSILANELTLFVIQNGYVKTVWQTGDLITANKLNNIEDGLFNLSVIVDELKNPYTPPSISTLINPSTTLYELGAKITTLTVNANSTKKKLPLTEIGIYKGSTKVKSTVFSTPSENNEVLSYSESNVNANVSFYSYVKDAQQTVSSGTISISFINPIYIGSVSTDVPSESELKSMSKLIVNPSNQNYSHTLTSKRMCIAVPSSNWIINSIIDPNGFNITSSYVMKTINITCLDGIVRPYKVYISGVTSQTGFTVQYKI